ncbi:MAG: response regulator [Desulfovibrionaceae bacterium]
MDTQPIRVLVIDDEELFRNNLIRMLSSLGMVAKGADSGAAALEALAEASYDVALLDLKMPGMTGEEVLQGIKRQGFPVEVVVLTGHAAMDMVIGLLNQGAFDYVLKPYQTVHLLDTVKLAAGQRRMNHPDM